MKSSTKCILPWIHIATRTDGSFRPCCISSFSKFYEKSAVPETVSNIYTSSFSTALKSPNLQNIRDEMAKSSRPTSCIVCYKAEERGLQSKRLQENAKWKSFPELPQLKYLDLRFNSNCNLRCITCSPAESTSWSNEASKLIKRTKNALILNNLAIPPPTVSLNEDFWQELKSVLPDIEEIYFAGGEPLLQKEHEKCLDIIIENGFSDRIKLTYNTNGTLLKRRHIEKWEKFKRVQINLSIDGFGPLNEYIRYPSKWIDISETLRILDNSPQSIHVRLTVTIQALNIFYLKELIQWKIKSKFSKIQCELAPGDIDLNLLYFPKYLNAQILSSRFKKVLCDSLNEILSLEISSQFKSRVDGLILFLHEDQTDQLHERLILKEYLGLLDSSRELKSKDYIKDLDRILDLPEDSTLKVIKEFS